MSKVLLINPPFNIAKDNYDSSLSVGLLSIASYLDSKSVPVKIIDCVRQKNYTELIEKEATRADLVCFSVMTMQIPKALELSALTRKINSKCLIVWGGAHPTFFPEQTVSHNLIDVVVFGEGEYTVRDLAEGKKFSEIKGLAYKEGGNIIKNLPQRLFEPSQEALFNWDLEPRAVLESLNLIPSLTSRGCPHRCTFCVNAILKNSWRPRSAQQVLEDLKIIKSKSYFAGKKLRFWDENFFVDIMRARAIIDGMIANDLIIPWETTVRANYIREGMIDDEFMAKLKQSGCYLLSFGAESGCPRLLKKMKKDIQPEDVINSAKSALRHGIIPQYSFMIGLPGETRSEMMETLALIDRVVKLSPEIQILGPQAFRPYPGSELYDECVASGWQAPKTLEEWAHLAENELNYLAIKNFPWVKNKDKNFVESMEAYVRFGAHSIQSAMGSSVKAKKWLKLGFVLLCKLRWKLKFFWWPFEFKLAKGFVSGGN